MKRGPKDVESQDFQMFNDGVQVDNFTVPDAENVKRIASLNILLFNAGNLIKSECRFKHANALLTESFHALCIS